MAEHGPDVQALIQQAPFDREALGVLFEHYRPFLLLVAQRQIGPELAVRCDASDVVQLTLAEAQRGFAGFRGSSEPEFSAWIKQIHRRNITDLVRKRNRIAAEANRWDRSGDADGGEASACFYWREPAAADLTPSQHLVKGEQALRLAQLIQSLPEAQRVAVQLRHLEGWPLERIAGKLGRSVTATAGLIKRGLRQLRDRMSKDSWM